MTEVIPFKPEHIFEIENPDDSGGLVQSVEHAVQLGEASGDQAFTVRVHGKTVLCGGVVHYWAERGEAWALIDENAKPYFAAIHRAARKFFDECPITRIEASIPLNFEAGHRWIYLLGFDFECNRRCFMPDGSTWSLYARVK